MLRRLQLQYREIYLLLNVFILNVFPMIFLLHVFQIRQSKKKASGHLADLFCFRLQKSLRLERSGDIWRPLGGGQARPGHLSSSIHSLTHSDEIEKGGGDGVFQLHPQSCSSPSHLLLMLHLKCIDLFLHNFAFFHRNSAMMGSRTSCPADMRNMAEFKSFL